MLFNNHQPALDRLARIPLFAACTRRQLARVDRLSTELGIEPGYVMQREDDDASAFFVIVTGDASVSVDRRCTGHLRAGHFVGEVGLLDRGPNVTTVTAATPMDVVVFSRVEFRALLEVAPAAVITILRAHAAYVRAGRDLSAGEPCASTPRSSESPEVLERTSSSSPA
jgi:CRP/FNR family transcriptional regulator, cyclic AMP receptor protein